MWLPLLHSFSRKKSAASLAAGQYGNIRGMFGDSQSQLGIYPWTTARAAAVGGDTSTLFTFSAACYYFAQHLTDLMGDDVVPVGLMCAAVGGSIIQEWVLNSTIATACTAGICRWRVRRVWSHVHQPSRHGGAPEQQRVPQGQTEQEAVSSRPSTGERREAEARVPHTATHCLSAAYAVCKTKVGGLGGSPKKRKLLMLRLPPRAPLC